MRTLFFGLICALSVRVIAQPVFLRTYDLSGNVVVEGADITQDGGLIVAAIVDSSNRLVRLDASGNILWTRNYTAIGANLVGTFDGSVFNMRFMDVAAKDTGFVVVGYGKGAEWGIYSDGAQCMVLMDAQGIPEFSRSSYAHPWGNDAVAIDLASDVMLMAGRSGTIGGGYANLWRMAWNGIEPLQTYNTRGVVGQETWVYTTASSVRSTPDGGAVIAGRSPSMFIAKYDASFNVAWSGEWEDFDGGIVDGWTDGAVAFADSTRIGRFTPAGTIDWALALEPGYGLITGMAARNDGSMVLTGTRTDGTAWLAELDATGAVNWAVRIGAPGDDLVPADLMLAPDGGLRIVGTAGSAPGQLFSFSANASGEAGECSTVEVAPPLLTTTFTLIGTPSHYVGLGLADFQGQMVTSPTNIYGLAATACSDGGLLLQGTLFHDADGNGAFDTGETCFPNLMVGLEPDVLYTGVNAECAYDLLSEQPGTHVISPVPLEPWWALSTDSTSYTVQFNSGDSTIAGLDFGFIPAVDTTVVIGTFVTSPVVCNNFFGNPIQGWLHVLNTGTTQPGVVVALTLDSLLNLVSSEPPTDSIVGQTAYWHLDDIAYYSIGDIHMQLQSPALLNPPDTLYSVGAVLVPITLDTLGAFSWAGEVVCAYDPNDKQVTPVGSGVVGAIPLETPWLTYTVRFQNTGTFTATDVVVQDQLSPLVDPLTIQFLGASHALTDINLGGAGLVHFRFDNILLPDTGADEAGSHGHVTFRVRPRSGLHHLDSILNDAAIFFDQNEPVITNTVRNTIINCAESAWQAMVYDFGDGYLWANMDGTGELIFTYQWLLNDEPIEEATAMYWVPLVNGVYNVRMMDQYGCTKESEAVSVISTGMRVIGPVGLHVQPNPMTDVARLVSTEALGGDVRIELVDASGRSLRTMNGNGSREVLIERGHLESGLYVVRVMRGGEHLGSARLVLDQAP